MGGAISITDPDGKITEISGDPHINDKFNFKDNMTFRFGENRLEVKTVKLPNGTTVMESANVLSSDNQSGVRIDGLSDGNESLVLQTGRGYLMDDEIRDGTPVEIRHGQLFGDNKYGGVTPLSNEWIARQESRNDY